MSDWLTQTDIAATRSAQDAADEATRAAMEIQGLMQELRNSLAEMIRVRLAVREDRDGVAFDTGRVTTARDQLLPSEKPDLTPEERAAALVDVERDFRLATRTFVFEANRYQSRDQDYLNYGGASTAASIAIANGVQEGDLRWADPSKDFRWITADNQYVPMDAPTMVRLGQAAMRWRTAHIDAGRSIKNTVPIPANYKDDALWPTQP